MRGTGTPWITIACALVATGLLGRPAAAVDSGPPDDPATLTPEMQRFLADWRPAEPLSSLHFTPCVDGSAGGYPCLNVDLEEFLPLAAIGGGNGNDLWGWTDPETGHEYALMGRSSGTSFVDVTAPADPVYLGNLPTHTSNSSWRDIKTYGNYALIVSEASNHGMQVFDLTQLRNVVNPPVTFTETAYYGQFGHAHNLIVDEDTGFAYAVGSNTCSGGLHMVDVSDPLNPTSAGCFSADGYVHDAQCVVYHGPDADYQGHEICFGSDTDSLTLVDVTNKAAPVQVSRSTYPGTGYTHQAWLTEDHHYLLLDDELDEQNFGHNTWTYVWDVSDLDAPVLKGHHDGATTAIDHNQYVVGEFVYQADYRAGLRILHLDDLPTATLTEVAYFDIYPASDSASFNGAWSVYPFFASGTVIVSGIEQGLFVLHPVLCTAPATPTGLSATGAGSQQIDLSWAASADPTATYTVYRSLGGCPGTSFAEVVSGLTANSYSDTPVSGQVTYSYQVVAVDASGQCASDFSACAQASTTGPCTAPPIFAGVGSVTNAGSASCELDVSWNAATPNCGGPATYNVYRGTAPDFVPGPGTLRAGGLAGSAFADHQVLSGDEYYYIVRAVDGTNGSEDGNLVVAGGQASGPAADGTWATGAEIGDPILDAVSGFTVPAPEGVATGTLKAASGEPGALVPAGAGAMTPAGAAEVEHVGWHVVEGNAHSGARDFYSTYSDSQCSTLESGPIQLTGGQSSQMTFWTHYGIEQGFDGGVLEISTNGGGSWTTLTPVGGYPGTFTNGGNACGYAIGHGAYTGTQTSWVQQSVDLAAFNSQTVRVRWVFSTDGGLTVDGWYVDDIAITHAQVPGTCSGVLFADGFESGNTGGWSATVP